MTSSSRMNISENDAFFSAGVFAVCSTKAVLSKFFTGFVRSFVMTKQTFMPIPKMFFGANALKIICAVVCLNAVFMVNVFFWRKIVQPTRRHNTVHKASATQRQIPCGMRCGHVWFHLSKNFAAARYGKNVIVDTVFRAFHRKAYHVVAPRYLSLGTLTQS